VGLLPDGQRAAQAGGEAGCSRSLSSFRRIAGACVSFYGGGPSPANWTRSSGSFLVLLCLPSLTGLSGFCEGLSSQLLVRSHLPSDLLACRQCGVRFSCPVRRLDWRASSFPFRVDPAWALDGPSCRFFDWRYRRNALLTGPSLPPAGHRAVQVCGPRSPMRGDLIQFGRSSRQRLTPSVCSDMMQTPLPKPKGKRSETMTVPFIIGVVVGILAAMIGAFRAVSGANRRAMRDPSGAVSNLLPTAIVFGLLWGGIAFGVALGISLLV
jgi:hypothetical protein